MRRTTLLLVLASCAVGAEETHDVLDGRDALDGTSRLALAAPARVPPSTPPAVVRTPFTDLRGDGLSGGTEGANGTMWAIAEERRELHRFDRAWSPTSHVRVPLRGVAPDLELESAAWLGGSLIALGTERDVRDGADDLVLVARVDDDAATVVAAWPVSFGAARGGAANQGIEGLCAAGDTLLAAGEWVEDGPGGGRLAPLARTRHQAGALGAWEPLRLRLTSEAGKVSALDCAEDPDGALVVHAVERHFGVTRVLRFVVEAAPVGAVVEPVVVADLAPAGRALPNVEVLVLGSDRFWMVSDHDADDRTGTTELLRIDAPLAAAGLAP